MRPGHDSDTIAVQRSTRVVVARLTTVTAGLVAVVVAATVFFIVRQSHPRTDLDAVHPGSDRIFVDSGDLLGTVVLIGFIAILAAGAASWIIARSAVRPLGTALKLQREFVADASHELRTPLSVLDARLQLLERRPPADPAELKNAVGVLRRDTRALIDVVTDLLMAAEVASSDIDASADPVSVSRVLAETAAAMALVAESRQVRIRCESEETLWVRVPEVQLRRMITALLDNAVAHSPENGTVQLRGVATRNRVVISVSDEGPGIRGIAPERVFDRFATSNDQHAERFVRAQTGAVPLQDPARPTRRGFGIGLALVRDVAVRHGGQVEVASTSATGTTMRLALPRFVPTD